MCGTSRRRGTTPRAPGAAPHLPHLQGQAGNSPAGAGSSRTGCRHHAHNRQQPRGCGEQAKNSRHTGDIPGTAPRVRGADGRAAVCVGAAGNSPAGAGSRDRGAARRHRAGEQPRGCGEQLAADRLPLATQGTAPRVRGAALAYARHYGLRGNSPAGAGSSGRGGTAGARTGEQPAGAGSSSCITRRCRLCLGTAPRVRGAGLRHEEGGGESGNSPAGAGSRNLVLVHGSILWEQPRGCGEQLRLGLADAKRWGTAPRVRGAGVVAGLPALERGNSPAGAGSSGGGRHRGGGGGEQPRGCGEQFCTSSPRGCLTGTAPRVRGAGRRTARRYPRPGNSPAGAGSSPRGTPPGSAGREQPRGCGEQRLLLAVYQPAAGTAPRVRGAVMGRARSGKDTGNSPAGAGSRARGRTAT